MTSFVLNAGQGPIKGILSLWEKVPYGNATVTKIIHTESFTAGPSPRFKKWSGGRHGRVPKARVGESTRGGIPPLVMGVGGSPPRKF